MEIVFFDDNEVILNYPKKLFVFFSTANRFLHSNKHFPCVYNIVLNAQKFSLHNFFQKR